MNPRRCQTGNETSVKAFPTSNGNLLTDGTRNFAYADTAFASTNQPWTNGNNIFTAIAKDNLGRKDTNSVTVSLQSTNNYTYDFNGNLLSDGTRGFDYDDENQLIRVTATNGWKSEFTYDGKMRRRITKEFTWQSSAWVETNETRYIYDGNLVVQERNTNNMPTVEYTRGNDLSGSLQGAGGIGGLLARSQNSLSPTPFYAVSSYYHADGNGNITMLVDASQNMVAKYLYDPFGNTLAQSGLLADANCYRFSSKEWNQNSGLYYYLYRLYDPTVQRWVNRDRIEEFGGVNLFEFSLNDSIDKFDTLGFEPYNWPPDQKPGHQAPNGPGKDGCYPKCPAPPPDKNNILKDGIKKILSDEMKQWLAGHLGSQSAVDAKADCDAIKKCGPDGDRDANWTLKCMSCSAYKCATSASVPAAAEMCLKMKFAKCDAGVDP
jgi:RHS repeat-associated protein